MLVDLTPLYPLQSQAKVIKLQIQALKSLLSPLKSLKTLIEQKQLKYKCTIFHFSEILTGMLAVNHPPKKTVQNIGRSFRAKPFRKVYHV